MLSERDIKAALRYYGSGGKVYVMDLEEGSNMSLEDWLNIPVMDTIRFLIETESEAAAPDPEDQHTDEEFEALFEEVPEEALQAPKLTRAEKRHMIEKLRMDHPEMPVTEIAEAVSVTPATVRRNIK